MNAQENETRPVSSASDEPGTPGECTETIRTKFGDRTDRINNVAPAATSPPFKLNIIPLHAEGRGRKGKAAWQGIYTVRLTEGTGDDRCKDDYQMTSHLAKGNNVGARLRDTEA